MALVTLCPACGTTFRVRTDQLQVFDGKVRCGQCRNVFNGFASLITVDESEIIQSPKQSQQLSSNENPEPIYKEGVPDNDTDNLAPSFSSDWTDREKIGETNNCYPTISKSEKRLTRRWGAASFLLLVLLAGQVVYLYRTEVSQSIPETRFFLEKFCSFFSCTVPFPKQIEQLSIETSDLQINPKDQSKVITLTATIRNHASSSLALPEIKFSLINSHNQLIASRILTTKDYLDGDRGNMTFIKPHQEMDIKIYLDGDNLNATGYRLLLFYL